MDKFAPFFYSNGWRRRPPGSSLLWTSSLPSSLENTMSLQEDEVEDLLEIHLFGRPVATKSLRTKDEEVLGMLAEDYTHMFRPAENENQHLPPKKLNFAYALHACCRRGASKDLIVKVATACGPAALQRPPRLDLPLHIALKFCSANVTEYLYEGYQDAMAIRDGEGILPLHRLVKKFQKHIPDLEEKILFCAHRYPEALRISQKPPGQNTVLHDYISGNVKPSERVIRSLLELAPEAVQESDKFRRYSVMMALQCKRPRPIVDLLLETMTSYPPDNLPTLFLGGFKAIQPEGKMLLITFAYRIQTGHTAATIDDYAVFGLHWLLQLQFRNADWLHTIASLLGSFHGSLLIPCLPNTPNSGRLPIHLALDAMTNREPPLRRLAPTASSFMPMMMLVGQVKNYFSEEASLQTEILKMAKQEPSSLLIPDPVTGLFPFMAAASGDWLDGTFDLFRLDPNLDQYMGSLS